MRALKSIAHLVADPRVAAVEVDPVDGSLWATPIRGWTFDPGGAHRAHESTPKELLAAAIMLDVCSCYECAQS